jgi:ribose transport system ATP-binding protein
MTDPLAPAPERAGAAASPPERALELVGIGKTFGDHRALKDVDLRIAAGEVHALLGQNGSGKSTLIKVLSGFHHADPGTRIRLEGQEVDVAAGANAPWRRHLRFVHQDLALVESLDSVENLALERGFSTGLLGRVAWGRERRRARSIIERLGFEVDVRLPVAQLSPAERTMVAIARALQDWDDEQYGVLVLDEPTTSLSRREADRLYAAVANVAARGAGVLLVTHQLDEVVEVADRFTILRDGAVVATGRVGDVDEERLVELIIGRSVDRFYPETPEPREETMLAVEDLSGAAFGPVSFEVRAGEILGIAGLEGSGRELVASLLAGAERPDGGSLHVDGKAVAPGHVRSAMRAGIALLPADRGARGVVPDLSVRENVLLSRYTDVRSGAAGLFRLRRTAERDAVDEWVQRLDVRPQDQDRHVRTLSGGNQQKVVLARTLRLAPRVLVLDEPTQGVDVGARVKIYEQVADAARTGMAVVMCSSTDAELANECDRVLVMRAGRIAAELSGAQLTEDAIASESLSSAAVGRAPVTTRSPA